MSLDPNDPSFDEDGEHPCPVCRKMVTNARIRAMKGDTKCIQCSDQRPIYGVMGSDVSKGCGGTLHLSREKPKRRNRK